MITIQLQAIVCNPKNGGYLVTAFIWNGGDLLPAMLTARTFGEAVTMLAATGKAAHLETAARWN